MKRQRFARFVNGFDQGVAVLLVSKMFAHALYDSLPQFLAALFVDRLVSDDRELLRAGRHPNENIVLLPVLVHSETAKSFLRRNDRVVRNFAALNKNANLAGSF
jgi:hypothetical protein